MAYNFPCNFAQPTPDQYPPHYFEWPGVAVQPQNILIYEKYLEENPDASSKQRHAATRKERTKRWREEQRKAAARHKQEAEKLKIARSAQQFEKKDAEEGFCKARQTWSEAESRRNLEMMMGF